MQLASYQTVWFKIFCLVAAFASAWVLVRIRTHLALAAIRGRLSERLRERERIARELHDTLLQGMQALVLRIHAVASLVDPDSIARLKLDEVLRQSDGVIAEARDYVLGIRLETLESSDLPLSLTRLAEELEVPSTTSFRVSVTGEMRDLHPMILNETYRIAKEAISNSFRHSEATEITAEVRFGRRHFSFVVKDNGIGISEETLITGRRIHHWGLPGMRERARSIGADLTIRGSEQYGTQISMRLPASTAYGDERVRPRHKESYHRLKKLITFRSA